MKFSELLLLEVDQEILNNFERQFDNFNSRERERIRSIAQTSSPPYKYLNFIASNLTPGNVDNKSITDILNVLNVYQKLKPFLERKEISEYRDIDDLKNTLDEIQKNITTTDKNVNADILVDDESFYVVAPKDGEANCYYGNDTSFCSSVFDPTRYFEEQNLNSRLFYIIQKKLPNDVPAHKLILRYFFDGRINVVTSGNSDISGDKFKSSEKFKPIYDIIEQYMNRKYSKQIEIFKDKDKYYKNMFMELEKMELYKREYQLQKKMREDDSWFGTELGIKASIALQFIKENYPEFPVEDKYDLFADSNNSFTVVPDGDDYFNVLTTEEMEFRVRDYFEAYVEDGFDSFNFEFLTQFIDLDALTHDYVEMYEEMVRDDPENYLEPDDMELSESDRENLESLIRDRDIMSTLIDSGDLDDDELDDAQKKLDDLNEEIEDFENNVDKVPKESSIDAFLEDKRYEVERETKYIVSEFFGDNIDNYLDKEDLIDWLVKNEDWSGIGSYDNLVENYYVGGNEYYVFRS